MLCMTSEALDADDRGFLDEFFGASYSACIGVAFSMLSRLRRGLVASRSNTLTHATLLVFLTDAWRRE